MNMVDSFGLSIVLSINFQPNLLPIFPLMGERIWNNMALTRWISFLQLETYWKPISFHFINIDGETFPNFFFYWIILMDKMFIFGGWKKICFSWIMKVFRIIWRSLSPLFLYGSVSIFLLWQWCITRQNSPMNRYVMWFLQCKIDRRYTFVSFLPGQLYLLSRDIQTY